MLSSRRSADNSVSHFEFFNGAGLNKSLHAVGVDQRLDAVHLNQVLAAAQMLEALKVNNLVRFINTKAKRLFH